MKNYNTYIQTLLVILFVGFVACSDNRKYVNPKEMIEAEQVLLDRYYNETMGSGRTRLDSMSAAALDTVDHRFESGLMLFHTKFGDGDSIKLFKRVGYRYTAYIVRDTSGYTYEELLGTNEYEISPATYQTYIINDAASARQPGNPPLGINEALQHMRMNGECKIVLPSSIGGNNNYKTTVYEIKVTYLEQ